MSPCDPPDVYYLEAAQGWLELGSAESARDELAKINSCLRGHPDVLLLGWSIYARLRNWDEAHRMAEELVRLIPDDPKSWINRAVAVRYMNGGGITLAYEGLMKGLKDCSGNYEFLLYLARYSCQAGRLEDAREWLWRANQLGPAKQVALDEPDLEPLWEFVDQL